MPASRGLAGLVRRDMKHSTSLDPLAENAVIAVCALADAAGPGQWSSGAVEDKATALEVGAVRTQPRGRRATEGHPGRRRRTPRTHGVRPGHSRASPPCRRRDGPGGAEHRSAAGAHRTQPHRPPGPPARPRSADRHPGRGPRPGPRRTPRRPPRTPPPVDRHRGRTPLGRRAGRDGRGLARGGLGRLRARDVRPGLSPPWYTPAEPSDTAPTAARPGASAPTRIGVAARPARR